MTPECRRCETQICVSTCPTGAIELNKSVNEKILFNPKRCIVCGHCVRLISPHSPYKCPGARPPRSFLQVQEWKKKGIDFSVSIGPGLEYYSEHIKLCQVVGAWRHLGAKRVIKANVAAQKALSGILLEAQDRWEQGERLLIDSRCGAIRNLLDLLRPDLKPYLINADSTLYASARIARATTEDCRVVFVGPDIAYKKQIDIHKDSLPLNATITWVEFEALCITNQIDISKCDSQFDDDVQSDVLVPRINDLKTGLENSGIRFISLEYLLPHQIVSYFTSLISEQVSGFIAVLLCGNCIKGPGVYAEWKEQEDFKHLQYVNKLQDRKDAILSHVVNNFAVKEIIMGDKIEITDSSISNNGGQLFVGKFNSINACLDTSGKAKLAEALSSLANAVMSSSYITDDKKGEYVEVINQIGEEVPKQKPNNTLLKIISDGLFSVLKAVPDVANAVTLVTTLLKF